MFGRRKRERRDHCLNCANPLVGPYCHVCGQKDDDFRRPFLNLGNEFFADNFAWDARIPRSVLPFVFMPGELTRAYMRGERGIFVTPLRLYLVVSLVFFLMLVGSNVAIMQVNYQEAYDLEAELPELAAALGDVGDEHLRTEGGVTLKMFAPVDPDSSRRAVQIPASIYDLGDTVSVEPGGDVTEEQITRGFERFATGVNIALANPMVFNEILNDRLPALLVVLVPLFALMLGLFYVRRKFYLIDHLVFAIHFHAFLFLLMIAFLAKAMLLPAVAAGVSLGWVIVGASALYLLVGMKRVYGQGWIKTFVKFWIIFWTYFLILTVTVVGTSLMGLWALPRDYGQLPSATIPQDDERNGAAGTEQGQQNQGLEDALQRALEDLPEEQRDELEPILRRAMEAKADLKNDRPPNQDPDR